ncbi:MAG: glycoside hydrolase family 99-like domain-containing protein [Candidatus Omnitrophota bacterium]
MNACFPLKPEVVAIYFPSWHANDHYQAWYGKGFSEWELVKTAQPLYPGHRQPKVPVWGYFDESDPEWASREIDLAADHGVTCFMFDWYWYSGVRIMEEALEKGFLKAQNRNRLKFTVMWANHNWDSWPAVTGIPGMGKSGTWLPIRHWQEDCERVIDYCSEHYFAQPNYRKIDGKPNFIIYDIAQFTKQLGGVETTKRVLERMNGRAQKHGFPGLYFTANIGCCEDNIYCCGWGRVPQAKDMGFQSVFAYNIVRTPEYETLPEEKPVVRYEDVIRSHQYAWQKIDEGGLVHHPVVTSGLDVTPRWHKGVKLPMDFRNLSYEPIIEGNTPEQFGKLCKLAIERVQKSTNEPEAVFINAWNEWTEGTFLLPEQTYGCGYLEALREALVNRRPAGGEG